ncbi:MAG: hypothetical protein ACLP8A_05335 [Methylovirgula sp.]
MRILALLFGRALSGFEICRLNVKSVAHPEEIVKLSLDARRMNGLPSHRKFDRPRRPNSSALAIASDELY